MSCGARSGSSAGSTEEHPQVGDEYVRAFNRSTFLTLLVVPAVYSLIDGLKERVSGRSAARPLEPAAG